MRKNELMQRLAGKMFGTSVEIPEYTEEAAMCVAEVVNLDA